MKKNWNNPELKNLSVGCTNEGSCPAGTGVTPSHDFDYIPDCGMYCSVCGGCMAGGLQKVCPDNWVDPINKCPNACSGGCKPTQS